jgi:fluoride ion exporter CrcB/FEX
VQSGDIWPAAGYVAGSVLFCLAAVWGGWLLGRW